MIELQYEIDKDNLVSLINKETLKSIIREVLSDVKVEDKRKKYFLYKRIFGAAVLTSGVFSYKISESPAKIPEIKSVMSEPKHPVQSLSQSFTGLVNFESGATKLTKAHRERIDNFLSQIPKESSFDVYGFADSSGNIQNNESLALERAKVVQSYLRMKGFTVNLVKFEGSLNGTGWDKRRVDVIFTHTKDFVNVNLPEVQEIKKLVSKKPSNHKPKQIVVKRQVKHHIAKVENQDVLVKIGEDKDGKELFFNGDDKIIIRNPIIDN